MTCGMLQTLARSDLTPYTTAASTGQCDSDCSNLMHPSRGKGRHTTNSIPAGADLTADLGLARVPLDIHVADDHDLIDFLAFGTVAAGRGLFSALTLAEMQPAWQVICNVGKLHKRSGKRLQLHLDL